MLTNPAKGFPERPAFAILETFGLIVMSRRPVRWSYQCSAPVTSAATVITTVMANAYGIVLR
jgi:hypothetical protein